MKYVNLPSDLNSKKTNKSNKLKIVAIVILAFLLGILLIRQFFGSESISHFIFRAETLKSDDGKVNILLLGNAGGKHDGSTLTDTIMVVSLDRKTNQVTFISIPRDLWVDSIKAKVNAAYEYGEEESTGQGLAFSKSTIGEILALPLQYGIRLDFSGFEKAIDQVGGIEVEVDNSFDDYRYPITGKEVDLCGFREEEKDFSPDEAKALNIEPGKRKVFIAPDGKIATDSADPEKGEEYFACRFEHIHFDKGLSKMDGETALKYVRSRKGTNKEGTDFARSRRQQKVIEAFKSKTLSLETLANPIKIKSLIDTFGNSFETDIPIDDMIKLFGFSKKINSTQSIVLSSDSKNGLLINPPLEDYGGAWVLIPRTKDFSEIQNFVKIALEEGVDEATNSARPSNR